MRRSRPTLWRSVGLAAIAATLAVAPAHAASGWAPAGTMSAGRNAQVAAVLPDGRVLVAGGFSNAGEVAASDLFDPATGTWSATGSLLAGRHYATATTLRDGRVLVAGGFATGGVTASSELYDPATGTWSATGAMARARSGHVAALLPDGRVLVAGGGDSGRNAVLPAEVFDPATGTWSPAGTLAIGRENAQVATLPDGRVLLAGGYVSSPSLTFTATAEVFDPVTRTWAPTGSLATPRAQGATAVLPDGRVLVASGVNRTGFVADSERYDPQSGTWTTRGPSPIGNIALAATLDDGRVLVTTDGTATTPLLDAAAGTSAPGYALSVTRGFPSLSRLADGRVLVAGGTGAGGVRLASAELFTPATSRTAEDTALGTADVGSAVEHDVRVRNTGQNRLWATGVAVGGEHAAEVGIAADGCSGTSVLPGRTCTVRVRFVPGATGVRRAELRLTDNAETSPVVALVGVGRPAPEAPGPDPLPPSDGVVPSPPADPKTPAPAPPAPAGDPLPPGCASPSVVLAAIEPAGSARRPRVRLTAAASPGQGGKAARVLRDGVAVGTARVRADGTLVATVAAPRAARARAAARYRVELAGGVRSRALKATRLAAVTGRSALGGGRVRVTGRIAGVRRPTALRLEGTPVCGAGTALTRTVRTDRRGRFVVVLSPPRSGAPAVVYRLRQGTRTATLPIVVSAAR